MGRLFALTGACPGESAFTGKTLLEQKSWLVPSPSPAPQYKHKATWRKQPQTSTGFLICLHKALPPFCGRSSLLSQACLSSSTECLSQRRWKQTPTHTKSPKLRILQGLSSGRSGVRSQLTSRPGLTWLKLDTFRLGTKCYLQQANKDNTDNWPERKRIQK